MKPLASTMPEYLAKGRETAAIWAALEEELGALWRARDDAFLQLDVNTATWALPLWERAHGLLPDNTAAQEVRRERVKARMRGQGTTTAGMIQNVAQSFTNGEVEVEEYPDEYRMLLRFVGSQGIPPNVLDVAQAVDEIKPAHIAYGFAYTYITNEELRAFTHNQLKLMIHDNIRRPEHAEYNRAFKAGKTTGQ